MDAFLLIIFAAALFIFIRYAAAPNKKNSAPAPTSARTSSQHKPRAVASSHWPTPGNFDFDIVGEASYQPALIHLADEYQDQPADFRPIAQLIPESDNPYDRNAVRVDIGGKTVGYLSRDDAPRFRRRLGQKGLKNQVTTCEAELTGGQTLKNGKRAAHGVKLDIKPFD